ncbi:MAG: hypothetical protein PHQ39_06015, partial [Methanothrix soehngenii]|nr:hypothetical protein [Methanothrix soehngenii]
SGNSAAIAGMQMASNSNNAIIFFMSNTSCMHQAGPQKAMDNTTTYYNLSFSELLPRPKGWGFPAASSFFAPS